MSKPIKEQFVDWLRTKPADEEYDFDSLKDGACECAVTQFVHSRKLSVYDSAKGYALFDALHQQPYYEALTAHPWTFGALLSRLTPDPTDA